jgi:hypothetical protein
MRRMLDTGEGDDIGFAAAGHIFARAEPTNPSTFFRKGAFTPLLQSSGRSVVGNFQKKFSSWLDIVLNQHQETNT